MRADVLARPDPRLRRKLARIPWVFVVLLCLLAAIGGAMLYSAADASFSPWASRHLVRFAIALGLTLAVAVTDIRLWFRYAYAIYGATLALLVMVEVKGEIGMGAQRWIDLGVINLQPSELMKIALVLALARYFHGVGGERVSRPLTLLPPVAMILTPVGLVLKQPDLGTAMMLLAGGTCLLFAAGVRLWMFGLALAAGSASLPIAWQMLREYQRQRVLTFLDPERDPLGAGYHITQSKIALGSGGLFGKGFLNGTQSHLNFLPEKQTDFVFTMFAEEFGLVGTLGLLGFYGVVLIYCFAIALAARAQFARFLAIGVTTTFFLYVFINVAMVMGLIPVVGVPLPLVSYGGTAVLAVMAGFGLILSVCVHRDVTIGRHAVDD
jgi:rod shape determining protein RodA